jgi:hypothetical protein
MLVNALFLYIGEILVEVVYASMSFNFQFSFVECITYIY